MTLTAIAWLAPVWVIGTWAGVELVQRYSTSRALLDIPGHRSSHQTPMPRGGGLAIVVITVVGLPLSLLWSRQPLGSAVASYLLGSLLVAGISWLDDLRSLSSRWRLGAHVLAAGLALLGFGFWRVVEVPILGPVGLGGMGMAVTVLWIVGLTNAYNFMDGIDGIAGIQATLAGLGWCALASWAGWPLPQVLGLLLGCCSLGFLIHNWPPARIFMGDVGSTFLGYSFALLAVWAAQRDPRMALAGVLLVWPFVFDASFTFLRRWRRGENVFDAHRSHLYQRLVISGMSHLWVSCLYGVLALLGLALAWLWARHLPLGGPAVALILPATGLALWRLVIGRERRAGATRDPAQRKLHEREYFDRAYEQGIRKPAAKFYSIVGGSKGWYRELVMEFGSGKRVLEYGCGTGSYAFELGRRGAAVTGIDISEKAVQLASARAHKEGLADVSFAVMDAERTDFESASFDLVCGSGILHHLDVRAAMSEITRLLKPAGHAVFFEALGHNPLINAYRRLTPGLRSPDERPLKLAELELASSYFHSFELRFFHLLGLAAIPLRDLKIFPRLLDRLDRIDRCWFERMPLVRRYAWVAVLHLQGPRPRS